MLFNDEKYSLQAPIGYILIADLENQFTKSDSEILKPENTAFDEVTEGTGAIVQIQAFSRLGIILDIGKEGQCPQDVEVGDMVFYEARAATHIPIGPSTVVTRIPLSSILGIVKEVVEPTSEVKSDILK